MFSDGESVDWSYAWLASRGPAVRFVGLFTLLMVLFYAIFLPLSGLMEIIPRPQSVETIRPTTRPPMQTRFRLRRVRSICYPRAAPRRSVAERVYTPLWSPLRGGRLGSRNTYARSESKPHALTGKPPPANACDLFRNI